MSVRRSFAVIAAALPLAAGAAPARTSAPPPAPQERLAVLEFAGRADPSLLGQLADEVRSVAASELRARYLVMTRDAMAMLVKEMGGSCSEGDCEVETARNVGAALVVTGEVRTIGATLVLGLRLHETAKGALLGAETIRADDPLALLDRCRDAARALLRGGLGGPARAPAAGELGTFEEAPQPAFDAGAEDVVVSFETEPEGAVVRLDGQLLCERTPCRKRVVGGAHEAVFEKERYAAAAQRFSAAKDATVKAILAPRFGWISVETAPPDIAITLDGAGAGKSPVAAREVDEGTVEVAISDPCWLRSGERVLVKAGEKQVVRIEGKPRLAGLKVNAEDERGNALDAPVSVDGVRVGGAGETLRIPVCAKRVSVPIGNELFESELKLEEGKVAAVTAKPGVKPVAVAAAGGDMVRLPGGTYEMGLVPGVDARIKPFLLDVTEVTVAAYGACVTAGKCTEPVNPKYASLCTYRRGGSDALPVNCVEWKQATAYCAFVGKRLPTQEEWEWAARGGEKGTIYPWGNSPAGPQLCWKRKDYSRGTVCEVGSHPEGDSPHGVKDLAGNLREWTSSRAAWGRVTKGGSYWDDKPEPVSAWHRSSAQDGSMLTGFRCARSL